MANPPSARRPRSGRHPAGGPLLGCLVLIMGACGDSPITPSEGGGSDPTALNRIECSIPESQIFSGGVDRGQIPDLTDPELVAADDPDAAYLLDTDRVIGLRLEDEWVAVPHNILWWHEIINFNRGVNRVAVTYCPLTGSSIVFDRRSVTRFIVSGLLCISNLMMLDADTESLWPQMALGARCGPRDGDPLLTLPSLEVTWAVWRSLHPDTRVVSGETGFSRDYTFYPYDLYEEPDAPTIFPNPVHDTRRQTKERVLAVPGAGGPGLAFPFFELASAGGAVAAHETVDGEELVVFWNDEGEAAAAYRPRLDGRALTFEVTDGEIRDLETGSEWSVEGRAVAGPLLGGRLERLSDAFVAFWFAWATFEPGTRVWDAS